MEDLMENIINVDKDVDEHEIISNIEKLNEMKESLKMKLLYQKRKKEIMNLQKAKPEEFILKNTDHYRVITERLNEFEYIFQNKIPKTDNEEMNKHVGLSCKDLYEKQLSKLKMDYNEVLKQQTGKYLSEFKEVPEKYKFRGEVILQTSFFPVYYYLKPLLDSMSNIINNQEMILIKLLENMDDINERLDKLSSDETDVVITPEIESLMQEEMTEEEKEEELLDNKMLEHLEKIKEEIIDNMDNKVEIFTEIEKNILDKDEEKDKFKDPYATDSYSTESIFNQVGENEKNKEMMDNRIDKIRDMAQEKLNKRLEETEKIQKTEPAETANITLSVKEN
tara:strand:- start:245 stop:1255 length:1011 start_codon:yes stop_codon:yes gene_type:complete